MGLWAGLKWTVREGTGVGMSQRLARIFGEIFPITSKAVVKIFIGLRKQFVMASNAVVDQFGPAWARRKIFGYPSGTWIFLSIWLVLPFVVVLSFLFYVIPSI